MSKMKIKQRIALVAIAALGGSLISISSATTANAVAAYGDITQNSASTGIVTAYSSTASTVTMAADGILQLNIATSTAAIGVSGGKIIGFNQGSSTTAGNTNGVVITADGSGVSWSALIVNGLQFKPTAAGSNMTIRLYGPAAAAALAPTTAAAAAAASTSVLRQTITVTVVSAGASGTFSAGNSWISINPLASGTATQADTPNEFFSRGNDVRINYTLVDALGTAGTANMPANTSVMAQVTAGTCIIGLSAGVYSLPVVSEFANSGDFYVTNASDPVVATVCTVVISVNGTTVSTKSITFAGPASKIKISSGFTSRTSNASVSAPTGKGLVTVEDAAGNVLGGVTVTADTPSLGAIVSAAVITNNLTGSQQNGVRASSVPSSLGVTCTSTGGTTTVVLRTALSNGTIVKSDPVTINCAGDADSYVAGLDKATYVPGDIATLTITAKDSKGRLTHDAAVLGTGLTTNIAISGSNMTAVTAPSSADTFSSGSKTYTFIVGSTVGSYNMVVDLPTIVAASTTGQKAVTISYKIASSTSTVTNEEVLKSIVALIASINKQIQALQKLILARR